MISKILDNKMQGKVYEELQNNIRSGSKISIISGYFTIYAYASLKKEFNKIDLMYLSICDRHFCLLSYQKLIEVGQYLV